MNKETNIADSRVKDGSDHSKHGSATPQRSGGTTPIPKTQRESRSDQEQEGTQNPAGDTRDVNREPVCNAEDMSKK